MYIAESGPVALVSQVGEDGFDLGGRQYQFRHGQVRQFAWEDGTIQSVQSIQKTLDEVYKQCFCMFCCNSVWEAWVLLNITAGDEERGLVENAASQTCLATVQAAAAAERR